MTGNGCLMMDGSVQFIAKIICVCCAVCVHVLLYSLTCANDLLYASCYKDACVPASHNNAYTMMSGNESEHHVHTRQNRNTTL